MKAIAASSARRRLKPPGRPGVEMEALTAVQIALLTIYVMCKAVDWKMVLQGVRVVLKEGG